MKYLLVLVILVVFFNSVKAQTAKPATEKTPPPATLNPVPPFVPRVVVPQVQSQPLTGNFYNRGGCGQTIQMSSCGQGVSIEVSEGVEVSRRQPVRNVFRAIRAVFGRRGGC